MPEFSWLRKEGVIAAYSLRQACSGENDSAYIAAMNVSKACQFHVGRDSRTGVKHFNFAFPIIAVDTPLIRCVLNAKGEMDLEEVQQGEFLFMGHATGTCIRVITSRYLADFAREAKQVACQIQKVLSAYEAQKVDEFNKRVKKGGV